MKKHIIIFLLTIIISFPTKVLAADISNFKFDENTSIYDLAKIYSYEDEINIQKAIDRLQKISNLKVIVLTTDTTEEERTISNSIYLEYNNHNIYLKNNSYDLEVTTKGNVILIEINKEANYYIHTYFWGDKFNKNRIFKKFQKKYSYLSTNNINSPHTLISAINKCTKYFINSYIETFVATSFLALILTTIFLKIVKKRYNIHQINDAKNYYSNTTIEFIKNNKDNKQ